MNISCNTDSDRLEIDNHCSCDRIGSSVFASFG